MANKEWELLTSIITASNERDNAKLYGILSDNSVDFSDIPLFVQAAITVIELVPANVAEHKEILQGFVSKIDGIKLDVRSEMRLGILKQLLSAQ